jgi:hypothetical protein
MTRKKNNNIDHTVDSNDIYYENYMKLNNLASIVYDYIYEKNTHNYKIKLMNTKNIVLDRIKITPTLANIINFDFNKFINNNKFKLLGKYNFGLDVLRFKQYDNNDNHDNHDNDESSKHNKHYCTVTIYPYSKIDDINNLSTPENINKVIRTLLSELAVTSRTKNIILPILNVDVPFDKLKNFDGIDNTKNTFSVDFTEHFNKMSFLSEFIELNGLNEDISKSIFKQIIELLSLLSTTYPGFKHNLLKPEFIEVYHRMNKSKNVLFPEIKMSNFYLSEIKGLIDNNSIDNKLRNSYTTDTYSDLFYFVHHFNEKYGTIIDDSTKKFINDIYDKSLATNEGRLKDGSKINERYFIKNILNNFYLTNAMVQSSYNNRNNNNNNNNTNTDDTKNNKNNMDIKYNMSNKQRKSNNTAKPLYKQVSNIVIHGTRYLKPLSNHSETEITDSVDDMTSVDYMDHRKNRSKNHNNQRNYRDHNRENREHREHREHRENREQRGNGRTMADLFGANIPQSPGQMGQMSRMNHVSYDAGAMGPMGSMGSMGPMNYPGMPPMSQMQMGPMGPMNYPGMPPMPPMQGMQGMSGMQGMPGMQGMSQIPPNMMDAYNTGVQQLPSQFQ